jgi:biopolymer transport protein TolR
MSDPEDASLTAAQRGKIRRLSTAAPANAEGGELNVVPYLDIITNVMVFVLATVAVTFVSSVEAKAPSLNVRPAGAALGLTAFVVSGGLTLKTAAGAVAKGCRGFGGGVTVPKAAGAQDLEAIEACARVLKSEQPDFKGETQVTVTANPGTELQEVVSVMDALRGEPGDPLFPEVHFGVVR